MPTSLSSLRYVYRSLLRSPAFTAAAVLSLALGIGANTAIFTLADQMLLRVLPVKEPQRLVQVKWSGRFLGGTSRGLNDSFSYTTYAELRDANTGLAGLAARFQNPVDIAAKGPAQRATAELVSGNYFDVLGVDAALGRTLLPEDDRLKDAEPYVVLSYDYWRRRFGADPSVLNQVIDVNGWPMTVVGVAARGFRGFEILSPTDVFVPLAMKRAVTPTWDDRERRNSIWLKVFGRLKPGTSAVAAASAIQVPYRNVIENDLRTVGRGEDFKKQYRNNRLQFEDASKGFAHLQNFFAKPLEVLLVMVGTLLLIACVNVANLLVTRSAARQKEIAIRLSLGATRRSLIGLVMTESLVIAAAGGLLGLIVSSQCASLLVEALPFDNIGTAISTVPDWRILAFTAGLSLLTAILFGLLPALQISRPDLSATLKSEGNVSAGGGQSRLRRLLVAAQITLSLLLLVGAGLFARSLYGLFRVDSGLRADALLTFSVDPSLHKYSPQRSRQLFLDLQAALRGAPGAVSASGASFAVLTSDGWENTVGADGYRPGDKEDMQAGWDQVMPAFFSTMGAPLIAGREFDQRDTAGAPKVTIVNETFVKRFYPHQNPIGRHIGFGGPPFNIEIVGVVKDLKVNDLKENAKPWTFTPALQDESPSAMSFYVRSAGDPRSLASSVQQIVSRLDSSLPLYDLRTLRTQIDRTHFVDRLFAMLSAAFGLLATLLASIGLYGVTAYAVARRTQEIGIRIALGARADNILSLVMREVLVLAALGIIVGVPAALGLGRLVESQLFGVTGNDPAVLCAAVAVIALVSALAGYLPARRAMRIDPIRALRYE